jgi:hypothetical protein
MAKTKKKTKTPTPKLGATSDMMDTLTAVVSDMYHPVIKYSNGEVLIKEFEDSGLADSDAMTYNDVTVESNKPTHEARPLYDAHGLAEPSRRISVELDANMGRQTKVYCDGVLLQGVKSVNVRVGIGDQPTVVIEMHALNVGLSILP